jgi:drug/metabolite transporter (DMT)-like permease
LAFLFIAIRILANPLANVVQKQLTHRAARPIFIIAVVHFSLGLACLPYWFLTDYRDLPTALWGIMLACAGLAVGGNALLVYALKDSDLSVLGPINAYKSVVSLGLGTFMIGEWPTRAGVVGVLLIVAGSYFVIDRQANQPIGNAFARFFSERGIQLRLAALVLSATEAIFLKRAILLSSPMTVFVLWSVLGFPVALAASFVLIPREFPAQLSVLRQVPLSFAALVIAIGLMQLATVLTFRDFQVGYALALFQLSTIVSVFLGRRYFSERNVGERLVGSLIMTLGAALIVVFGRSG